MQLIAAHGQEYAGRDTARGIGISDLFEPSVEDVLARPYRGSSNSRNMRVGLLGELPRGSSGEWIKRGIVIVG